MNIRKFLVIMRNYQKKCVHLKCDIGLIYLEKINLYSFFSNELLERYSKFNPVNWPLQVTLDTLTATLGQRRVTHLLLDNISNSSFYKYQKYLNYFLKVTHYCRRRSLTPATELWSEVQRVQSLVRNICTNTTIKVKYFPLFKYCK